MKRKKRLLAAIAIILFLILCIPVKLFLIGEPVDGGQLVCRITERENGDVILDICTPASAMALRGWKIHQNGDTMTISARKVLVSPLFCTGTHSILFNSSLVKTVILGGKTVWAAAPKEVTP